MVSVALIQQGFLGQLVVMLDYWILILVILALLYLIYRLPRLVKRQVAVTYIVLMSLLVFWSLRHMAENFIGSDMMFGLTIFSFLVNLVVTSAIVYMLHLYIQLEDIDEVLATLDLEAETEEEQEDEEKIDYDRLDPGKTYLIEEQGGEHGLKLFRGAITQSPGLCFSYKNPQRLRDRHNMQNTPVVWISGNAGLGGNENTMNPANLDVMLETIIDFIEEQRSKDKGQIIIIDGFELLVYNNPFTGVMSFVERLMNRYGDDNDVTFIFAVESEGIYDEQREMLEKAVDEIHEVNENGVQTQVVESTDEP